MRLLEDAVQVAQMQQSNVQHPLLKTPFQYELEELPPEDMEGASDHPDDLADALGSLHINEKDKSMHWTGDHCKQLRIVDRQDVMKSEGL